MAWSISFSNASGRRRGALARLAACLAVLAALSHGAAAWACAATPSVSANRKTATLAPRRATAPARRRSGVRQRLAS